MKKGRGTGTEKGMASLKPGLWMAHKFDKHNGEYEALCQRSGQVTVIRDGDPPYEDTGMFGINIHRGSRSGTSSAGCQTLHPDQWDGFISTVKEQAKRYHGQQWNKVIIPYVLLEETSAGEASPAVPTGAGLF
jgi:lysozyme